MGTNNKMHRARRYALYGGTLGILWTILAYLSGQKCAYGFFEWHSGALCTVGRIFFEPLWQIGPLFNNLPEPGNIILTIIALPVLGAVLGCGSALVQRR